MDHLSTAPSSSPSTRPDRITPLPHLGRDVEAWMWKVLNGGTVLSDRRADDLKTVQKHAQALREVGLNGQADAPLDERIRTAATEYARLLGWRIEDAGDSSPDITR